MHDVSLKTKIAVYRAVVLTTLLYGCETWTLYRRSIRRLDQFHLRCLRNIARVKWQDKISNTEVLNTSGIMGIEAFLLKAQRRLWGVHDVSLKTKIAVYRAVVLTTFAVWV